MSIRNIIPFGRKAAITTGTSPNPNKAPGTVHTLSPRITSPGQVDRMMEHEMQRLKAELGPVLAEGIAQAIGNSLFQVGVSAIFPRVIAEDLIRGNREKQTNPTEGSDEPYARIGLANAPQTEEFTDPISAREVAAAVYGLAKIAPGIGLNLTTSTLRRGVRHFLPNPIYDRNIQTIADHFEEGFSAEDVALHIRTVMMKGNSAQKARLSQVKGIKGHVLPNYSGHLKDDEIMELLKPLIGADVSIAEAFLLLFQEQFLHYSRAQKLAKQFWMYFQNANPDHPNFDRVYKTMRHIDPSIRANV